MSTFEEAAGAHLATVDHDKSDDWVAGYIAAIVWARARDAKVRAEALREAVDDFEGNVGVAEFGEQIARPGALYGERYLTEAWEMQGPYMAWMRNRADRIEQEAGD